MSYTEAPARPGSRIGLLIKRLIFLALPLLVLVGSVGGFVAMGALRPAPEEKADIIEALPVLTATARTEPVSLKVRGQGAVNARTEVSLASEISGRVRLCLTRIPCRRPVPQGRHARAPRPQGIRTRNRAGRRPLSHRHIRAWCRNSRKARSRHRGPNSLALKCRTSRCAVPSLPRPMRNWPPPRPVWTKPA